MQRFLIIFVAILGHCLASTILEENFHGAPVKSPLHRELTELLQELEELEEEQNALKVQVRSPAIEDRHGTMASNLFSAYISQAGNFNCVAGRVTGWTETLDLFAFAAGSQFNPSTGIFTAADIPGRNHYFYFSACMMVSESNMSTMRMLLGGTAVAAFSNRQDFQGGVNRHANFCNSHLGLIVAGNQAWIQEEGGSNNNCKRGNWRNAQFNGFTVASPRP